MILTIAVLVLFALMGGWSLVEAEVPPMPQDVGVVYEQKLVTIGDALTNKEYDLIIADIDASGIEHYYIEFTEDLPSPGRFELDAATADEDMKVAAIEVRNPNAFPLEIADGTQFRRLSDMEKVFGPPNTTGQYKSKEICTWITEKLIITVQVSEKDSNSIVRYSIVPNLLSVSGER